MAAKHDKLFVMTFGRGGNHGYGITSDGNVFTRSWYLAPDELQRVLDSGRYSVAEMEGCVLIDLLKVVDRDPMLSIDAPMVDVKLQEGETFRMADLLQNHASAMVVAAVSQEQPIVAAMATKSIADNAYRGLDKVSPAEYVAWWRKHGATIGKVENGQVLWEGQTLESNELEVAA